MHAETSGCRPGDDQGFSSLPTASDQSLPASGSPSLSTTEMLVSQIFAFSLYLSWSHAGVYPDARPAPIIPPDAPSRPDGGDAPLPLMRLMR
jgi:hypothetical protein